MICNIINIPRIELDVSELHIFSMCTLDDGIMTETCSVDNLPHLGTVTKYLPFLLY